MSREEILRAGLEHLASMAPGNHQGTERHIGEYLARSEISEYARRVLAEAADEPIERLRSAIETGTVVFTPPWLGDVLLEILARLEALECKA